MVANLPTTASSSGLKGDMALDPSGGWVYFCYATNLWIRSSAGPF